MPRPPKVRVWYCDRCLRRYQLTPEQVRIVNVDRAPTPADATRLPVLLSVVDGHTRGRICEQCVAVADPAHPLDHTRSGPGITAASISNATKPVTERVSAQVRAVTPITPVVAPTEQLLTAGVIELGSVEAGYVAASRADATVRGYRSDWNEWTVWCRAHEFTPLPAAPAAIAKYLSFLAGHGAKVGTMSRRRSAIRFAHAAANLPSPLDDATVAAVWEGIRRVHGAPPDRSSPLMPPLLWRCIDATPTRTGTGEASLSGMRDRVLLLVGFVGALRRSELTGIDIEHLEPHDKGLVVHIPKSKTNQYGDHDELVILPRNTQAPDRCPVATITAWRRKAGIDTGPLLRGLKRTGQPRTTRLSDQAVTDIIKAAVTRAGTDPDAYTAHSLRAGFVTWANLLGESDRAIARQTRHRSMQSIGHYVRITDAWQMNAANNINQ